MRDGFLVDRGLSHGHLNAPWGIALAPAGFGRFQQPSSRRQLSATA
jgi:hypothetical protein